MPNKLSDCCVTLLDKNRTTERLLRFLFISQALHSLDFFCIPLLR